MIVKSVPENVLKNKNYQNNHQLKHFIKCSLLLHPVAKQRSIMPTKNYTLLYWKMIRYLYERRCAYLYLLCVWSR